MNLLRAIICFSAVFTSQSVFAEDEFRTWTDRSGEFELKAKFVELVGSVVHLENEDGEEFEIELDALNVESRIAAQKAAMFAKKGTSPFKRRSSPSSKQMNDEEDPDAAGNSSDAEDGPRLINLLGSNIDKHDPRNEDPKWELEPDGLEITSGLKSNGLIFDGTTKEADYFAGVATSLKASRMVWAYSENPAFAHRNNERISRVVEVDLNTGTVLRTREVNQTIHILALSDDGETMLTYLPGFGADKSTELVAWDLSDPEIKPIWACQPFGDAGMFKKDITWGTFLPDGHVAVMSSANLIGVFLVERGRRTDLIASSSRGEESRFGGQCVPGLSPGGRFMAVCNGTGLAVYTTQGLRAVAATNLPNEFNPTRVAFTGDGTQLMVLGSEGLLVLDVKTGQTLFDLPRFSRHYSGSSRSLAPLCRTAEGFYLAGDTLVDAELEIPVWTYRDLVAAHRCGNKVVLGFNSSFGFNKHTVVAGVEAPNANARRILKSLANRPDLAALGPGDSVKIDVSKLQGTENQRVARESLEKWAAKHNVTIDDSASRVLTTAMIARDPKTIYYFVRDGLHFMPMMFRDKSEGTPVTHTPYSAELSLTIDGEEVWKKATSFEGSPITLKKGQAVHAAVQEARKPRYHVFGGLLPEGRVLKQNYVDGSIGSTSASSSGLTDRVSSKL